MAIVTAAATAPIWAPMVAQGISSLIGNYMQGQQATENRQLQERQFQENLKQRQVDREIAEKNRLAAEMLRREEGYGAGLQARGAMEGQFGAQQAQGLENLAAILQRNVR